MKTNLRKTIEEIVEQEMRKMLYEKDVPMQLQRASSAILSAIRDALPKEDKLFMEGSIKDNYNGYLAGWNAYRKTVLEELK